MGQKRKLGSLFSLFSLFSLEVRKGLFLLISILFLLVLTLVSLFLDDILAFTLSPVGGRRPSKGVSGGVFGIVLVLVLSMSTSAKSLLRVS